MIRRSLSILFWSIFFFLLIAFFGGVQMVESWRTESVTIDLVNKNLTTSREAVIIDFSRAMRVGSLQDKIAFSPSVAFRSEWQQEGKRLVLFPESKWPIDTTYRLTLGQGQTTFFSRTSAVAFTVHTPSLPKILSITPSDGAKDVLLGVEDPIRVEFDRSARDFYVDFQLDPPVTVVYQNNDDKTVFEMLPKTALDAGKEYALSIRARYRDDQDGEYWPMQKISFATLPPQPIQLSRDFGARIEEAKRFTRPRYQDGNYIDVNLANQVMTLFENGRAIDAYIISSGKPGMETPKGNFFIENQAVRPWSKQYGLYMPYWQAITPDGKYGIHELPEWPSGYKEGANHLGIPVSHGCMRLGVGPAQRLFEWADIGTPVVIY